MDIDEKLAWEHINVLVTKNYFKSEYEKSMQGIVTSNCRQDCSG